MKNKELIKLIELFKDLLEKHRELWKNSLSPTIPDYPERNIDELENQQKELYKLFYQIDGYLYRYSRGRIMYHPATGSKWDIYRSAIGDDVAQIKGRSLREAILDLEGILAVLKTKDPEEETETIAEGEQNKKIFISHGKRRKILEKVKNLLTVLGLEPIVVEEKPSEGKSVDVLVLEYMNSCVAAIIIATKDDKVISGERTYYQPRQNVIHEIGLAQQALKNRVIYLKEKGCEFPSNIKPRVWEDFTSRDMENAFIKIIKELRSFGILK
ncbi:MAG: nucleotide-binding protein [Nitrososphaeria archaeon]